MLFLHGTSGHLEAFTRNIVPHVEAGFRCHAIDLLGHGYTDKPDYHYEIPRYVAHVLGYLDAAGIDRAHLVGESLGGWVSAWLASEQPRAGVDAPADRRRRHRANPEVMERIRTSTLASGRARRSGGHPTAPRAADAPRRRQRHRRAGRRPPSHLPHARVPCANIDHLLCLQDMEIRQRNLLQPERLATLADIADAHHLGSREPLRRRARGAADARAHPRVSRLELYPECGHWPQYEHPELYNPMSIAFLRERR